MEPKRNRARRLSTWRQGRTLVMGIINLSPDSFSGDGLAPGLDDSGAVDRALEQARRFVAGGADILDVGGEDSRPGAAPILVDAERRRVVPVVRALASELAVPISIDTYKSAVAEAVLAAGAAIVNDITGLRGDPELVRVAARHGAAVVAMHMQGTPRTMQRSPHFDDLIGEIRAFLDGSVRVALAAGIPPELIAVDPGIGFGKTIGHNLEILRRLDELRIDDHGLLIGTSRKAFIGRILGTPPDDRLEGTAATIALAIAHGADVVRVHDIPAMARVARVADAIVRGYVEPAPEGVRE